ncbi:hypothetical protein K1719_040335 [Acacia pycnantha]|nr:hypothetical protein K1719_040335 [Acacia pycnantha]
MGKRIDHSLNSGGGPCTLALSRVNYHNIGIKHQKDNAINPKIVDQIKKQLDEINPFFKQFCLATEMLYNPNQPSFKMCLIGNRKCDARTYHFPSALKVAVLIVGDTDINFNVRDVIPEAHEGTLQRINELHASYLPLQYPILFSCREDGYKDDIPEREETLILTKTRKRVCICEFISYILMTREHELCTLHHASRLLQQFKVDAYTMIESQRLSNSPKGTQS